jgi:hypothetical protein
VVRHEPGGRELVDEGGGDDEIPQPQAREEHLAEATPEHDQALPVQALAKGIDE